MVRLFPSMILVVAVACAPAWFPAVGAAAEARVEVELVTSPTFPAIAQQQWYQLLSELRVDGLRIRKAAADDKTEVKTTGTKTTPTYHVVGVLTSAGQLELPGGKFSQRDRGPLADWLKNLRANGPSSAGGSKSPFGLTQKQFAAVNADLANRVAFSTEGLTPAEVLDKLGATLNYSVVVDRSMKQQLAAAEPVSDELEGLTAGAAIAYVLRSEGLGLLPRAGSKQPEYAVVKPAAKQTTWPVGWPLGDRKPHDVLPKLFETLNAEIDVPLTDVIDSIAERLDVVVLYDHYALARQGIDLAKLNSRFPASKTWYAKVVDRVLHQSGLTGEWRLDDAGKPLLWVTTLKPVK
ncbi:MAG TPA: hypothetical protein VHC22_14480 [Pirellulales bacterium]|nr:hypothetical protein [Pirellulales bacterium]